MRVEINLTEEVVKALNLGLSANPHLSKTNVRRSTYYGF